MEVIKNIDWNTIVPYIKDWAPILISVISLLLAGISLAKSSKAQKLQNRVNELEVKIKEYEVSRIEKEKAESKNSCVEARVIDMGQNKHRLKVWNSGNTKVFNVVARFEDGSNIIVADEEKLPFDELEVKKSFEIILITHMGSASKFKIVTEWDDEAGEHHIKTQMGDL